MNRSDQVRFQVDMADDIAEGVKRLGDYRAQYVNVGLGLMHSINALALSVDRFAAAIEKPTQEDA